MPYRYEQRIDVIIAAGGLDSAAYIAERIRQAIERDPDVISARAPGLDLHHRNDLDGALRERLET